MARKTKEELNKLKLEHEVDELWSWSKYNTYKNSSYEYFLKYIIHKKEDRDDGAYTAYGSLCHDILEKYYTNQISYEQMSEEFEDSVILLDMADLKFDRSSEEKNQSIKDNYLKNLMNFFVNHKILNGKNEIEKFLVIKIGNNIFQGYADLIRKDADNNIIIQDWKTSTIYKGDKALKEAGQLFLYAEGLVQLGVPVEKIKVCWDFLKYTTVTTTQSKGEKTLRDIERNKIGESLKANCKMWLKKLGYTEDIDNYIEKLVETNDIKCLPKDVQEKYEFNDCYVYLDINKEILNDLKKKIIDTIYEIKQKTNKYTTELDENIWFDSNENVEKQSFYFANLCGYSANIHKPYKLYLDKYNAEKNGNVFSGVGKDTSNDKNDNQLNNNINNDINNEDFGWLNLI